MFKFLFFILTTLFMITVFASNTPNNTNANNTNNEAPLELFETEEDTIPSFLEDENEDDGDPVGARVLGSGDSEWLQFACNGQTIFVKPEDKQWYEENCIQVLDI